VDLWDIEVITDPKLNEDIFMGMEDVQAILHGCESVVCLLLELCIVDEVKQRASDQEDVVVRRTGQETNEDSFHLLMLHTCPLGDHGNALLEVANAWVMTDSLESGIHLLLPDNAQTPLYEVVVEDSFVKLMDDVRCDAGKDVGEGKVLPKRFIDFAQAFRFKLSRLFVYLPPLQGLQHVEHIAVCAFLEITSTPQFNQTARALTLLVTTHQTLLWKVSNIGSKNWMDLMHTSVSANHVFPSTTSIGQQMQDQGHHIVE